MRYFFLILHVHKKLLFYKNENNISIFREFEKILNNEISLSANHNNKKKIMHFTNI